MVLNGENVNDIPSYERSQKGLIYLPQQHSVFMKATVFDNLFMMLELVCPGRGRPARKRWTLLGDFGLLAVRDSKAYQLSGGEKRRLEIARSMIMEPRFLFLDEPFTGIDPITILDIQKIILKLKALGIGIIITDHNVKDTFFITDLAYIIHKGHILSSRHPGRGRARRTDPPGLPGQRFRVERLKPPLPTSSLTAADWRRKSDFFRSRFSPCRLCPRRCGAERDAGQPGVCQAVRRGQDRLAQPPFRRRAAHLGKPRLGHGLLFGLHPEVPVLPELPDLAAVPRRILLASSSWPAFSCRCRNAAPTTSTWCRRRPTCTTSSSALEIASGRGLNIPLVYNTSGYERVEVIAGLAGIVDIYLPDLKYGPGEDSRRLGLKLSGVGRLFRKRGRRHRRNVPPDRAAAPGRGRAWRCAARVIRHLIIPGHAANSLDVLRAIAASPFRSAWLSLMSQYFPAHRAPGCPPFDRRLRPDEYRQVRDEALRLGLEDGWFQDMD